MLISDLPDRIAAKIEEDPSTGCWLWTAFRNPGGYGMVRWGRQARLAHRVVYALAYEPCPPGLELDHFACDCRACVNPDHVRPVTRRENSLRGDTIVSRWMARTACDHGHPFDTENTQINRRGCRVCRACVRDRSTHRRLAKKEQSA